MALDDASGLDETCQALENGRLTTSSGSSTRDALAGGNAGARHALSLLSQLWSSTENVLSGRALAIALRASVSAVAAERRQTPQTEVVWTGPNVVGSFLRTTREVVREILRNAKTEILIVGYWIAARDNGEGIIEEVIASLAEAVSKGVRVTMIVDERLRPDGRDNRGVLLSLWPTSVPLPNLLTWRLPPDDRHLKLHAKTMIADRREVLITSANLTSYALDRNIEVGVRIVGRPAADIAKHFDALIRQQVVVSFGSERDA
jgi:cardiolipin synthase